MIKVDDWNSKFSFSYCCKAAVLFITEHFRPYGLVRTSWGNWPGFPTHDVHLKMQLAEKPSVSGIFFAGELPGCQWPGGVGWKLVISVAGVHVVGEVRKCRRVSHIYIGQKISRKIIPKMTSWSAAPEKRTRRVCAPYTMLHRCKQDYCPGLMAQPGDVRCITAIQNDCRVSRVTLHFHCSNGHRHLIKAFSRPV